MIRFSRGRVRAQVGFKQRSSESDHDKQAELEQEASGWREILLYSWFISSIPAAWNSTAASLCSLFHLDNVLSVCVCGLTCGCLQMSCPLRVMWGLFPDGYQQNSVLIVVHTCPLRGNDSIPLPSLPFAVSFRYPPHLCHSWCFSVLPLVRTSFLCNRNIATYSSPLLLWQDSDYNYSSPY